MLTLDHLVVSATRLDDGIAYVQDSLHVTVERGGQHVFMGTHNALMSLGPSAYLEVIAIDPELPPPDQPRWFGLDRFEGPPRLTNWVCRSDDLVADHRFAPNGMGRIMDAARGDLRWQMAVPEQGQYPFDGCFPGMIQWQAGGHPAERLPDRGVQLEMLKIEHLGAIAMGDILGTMFDMDKVSVAVGAAPRLVATLQTASGRVALT